MTSMRIPFFLSTSWFLYKNGGIPYTLMVKLCPLSGWIPPLHCLAEWHLLRTCLWTYSGINKYCIILYYKYLSTSKLLIAWVVNQLFFSMLKPLMVIKDVIPLHEISIMTCLFINSKMTIGWWNLCTLTRLAVSIVLFLRMRTICRWWLAKSMFCNSSPCQEKEILQYSRVTRLTTLLQFLKVWQPFQYSLTQRCNPVAFWWGQFSGFQILQSTLLVMHWTQDSFVLVLKPVPETLHQRNLFYFIWISLTLWGVRYLVSFDMLTLITVPSMSIPIIVHCEPCKSFPKMLPHWWCGCRVVVLTVHMGNVATQAKSTSRLAIEWTNINRKTAANFLPLQI